MKAKSKLVIHPDLAGAPRALKWVKKPFHKVVYDFLRARLFKFFRSIPFFRKLLLLANDRVNFFDESCCIYQEFSDGPVVDRTERAVFNIAQRKVVTPEGYCCFGMFLDNPLLVGHGLVPMSAEGHLAKEALTVNSYYDMAKTTNEIRPLKCRRPIFLEGKSASLASHWTYWKNFYHWLMDVVPRLRFIEADRKLLVASPLTPYERDFLELVGIIDRCVFVNGDYLKVENFQFISPIGYAESYVPENIDYVRDLVLENVSKRECNYPKKIYVTRRGESRSPKNEVEFEGILIDNEWSIVNLRDYSFEEQVKMFKNATHVAGVHGAGLANLLWARSTCKVVEIFPSNRLVPTNENIALHLGLDYLALVCKATQRREWNIDVDFVSNKMNNMKKL